MFACLQALVNKALTWQTGVLQQITFEKQRHLFEVDTVMKHTQKHHVGTALLIISLVQTRVLHDIIRQSLNKLIDTFHEYLTLFERI